MVGTGTRTLAAGGGSVTRRGVIQASLASGLSLLSRRPLAPWHSGGRLPALPAPARRPGAVRFVHMTDIHLRREAHAEAFGAMLESVQAMKPAPDFIITGGDHIMDGFEADRATTEEQWSLYHRALCGHARLPVFPAIGNHDVWDWVNPLTDSTRYADYGKALAMDRLCLSTPYYSFDHGGWHFIILDNIAPRPRGYYGGLDAAQAEWLRGDLRQTGRVTPVCIVSHIPILAACVFFDTGVFQRDHYSVWDCAMHRDAATVLDLLKPPGTPGEGYNVKLLLSGHIHLLDRVEHRGMTFICGGAVCGNWWNGPYQGLAGGSNVLDLRPDGSFEHRYVTHD